MEFLLWVLAVLFVIAAALYYLVKKTPRLKLGTKTPDHFFIAEEIVQEFIENEAASNKKYIDKIITVSGKLIEKSKDESGATVLLVKGFEHSNLLCTLEKDQNKVAETIEIGTILKVKGKCTGFLMDVVLNKGVLDLME